MLTLNGIQISLKNLRISVRQQLAGQDMSGQSSATDQAETGNKGKVLAVSGIIPFSKPEILSNLFNMAGGQQKSARQIYRISNKTASTLKVREVKFQGTIRADEQESLRQWSVAFELVEHLSVPERVEQRQQDQPATQQQVQGVTTPVEAGQSEDVPPDTSIELTGVMKVLKSIDDALA
ncbi:adenine glycosylase [Vibrio parahaemolyticus]|uniref:baseplate complex protein n=1 Tax=Vibrio parahaemolyticus TaxID=670 RepID=UPI001E28F08D|nr:adenine glycosylase [Vibrio parahaemolyticus]MCD2148753.1 adenine glycosylase [Vibrio parahaemolyticus]HCJ4667686.1 adenine glycosylase [Vibrio parahaemolyticus]